MSVTVQQLIGKLPPYQDQWIQVHPNQTVKDIMAEIVESHKEFAPYYDEICSSFDDGDTETICDNLYFFLKDNIRYKEETEKSQTTALPTGILTRQQGDCKHYAGFAAGILDALNRQGKKIKWCYVFASYKFWDTSPHHVFVEVEDRGKKIWIDPTPGAASKEPTWLVRKKVNMPLHKNIAGFNDPSQIEVNEQGVMGKRPPWQLMPVQGIRGADGLHGTNKYFTGPFLALQHYLEDPYSVEGTNWNTTADAINAEIAKGPEPGHSVNADFVKWIYEKSMKGWNFYYPMGVEYGYTPAVELPSWYPKLIINDEGKLQFDRYYPVDDYMNDEIHAITAWAQDKINNGGFEVFPITPRAVKEYSQGKNTDNLFNEDRGVSALKRIWKGFSFWNLYSMRGSYLNLVRANWFHLGKKLWEAMHNKDGTINNEGYQKLYDVWGGVFGGKMDHLVKAAENGKFKPAVDDKGNVIGEAIAFAAWVAAAVAVIAAMGTAISQILKSKGQKDGVDYLVDPATGLPYPTPTLPPDDGGILDPGGIVDNVKKNPLPYIAAGAGLYLLLSKKKKAVTGITGDILPLALLAYGAWYFFIKPKDQPALELTVQEMRDKLFTVKDKVQEWVLYVTNLTEQEVKEVYNQYFK